MNNLKDFTNKYPLSKTLRFRLEPQGDTLNHIQNYQILENDERRSKEYKKMKEMMDDYHRNFIDKMLDTFILRYQDEGKNNSLQEFERLYSDNTIEDRSELLEECQKNLRKSIAEVFRSNDDFGKLFKKEMVTEILPRFISNEEDLQIVKRFSKFTTYFTGFYQNRQNVYTAEAIHTAVAHRIVNENLPKFIDNMHTFFRKIVDVLPKENLEQLYADFEDCLNVNSIAELFELRNFTNHLSQAQIMVYNGVIGGRTEDGKKIQAKGLNQYINLYNQTHKEQRLPKLKPLFNQILSKKEEGVSFIPEQFAKPKEVLTAIAEMWKELSCEDGLLTKLKDLLLNIDNFQHSGVYIPNDLDMTDICQKHFGKYDVVKNALIDTYKTEHPIKKGQKQEKYEEQIKKYLKTIRSLSLAQINALVPELEPVQNYFKQMGAINNGVMQREDLFALIDNRHTAIEPVLNIEQPTENDLKDNVENIKDFLDAIKDLQRFLKPLNGAGDEADKDDVFYGEFTPLYGLLDGLITPLYNKTRNYITRNPKDENKFKINFESSTLLDGWDYTKEDANLSVILRKGAYFYLAIASKEDKSGLKQINQAEPSSDNYEKMDYKLLPSPFKMLPKVMFAKSRIDEFAPSDDILRIRETKSFQKGDRFSLSDLHKFIDFYKQSIPKNDDWKWFNFNFTPTEKYNSIDEFYSEVEEQGYFLGFHKVPVSLIDKLVSEGKLFLFKITGKDFSPHSKGRPNLHTIYWRMLFDEQNLKDVVYKLNGQAEIFFRRKFVNDPVVHKANKPVDNKSDYNKQHKPTSKFEYDIVKDRRFTLDQFTLHVPITMNFKSQGNGRLNDEVKSFIKNKGIRHIIGIDRGERHLLYLSMIDMDGNIVQQRSLNSIPSNPKHPEFSQDYHEVLNRKEGDRLQARRNWTTIENIKELKEGYLSQVVHVLATMMVENDAILVLENLNSGFMRGRQKVEKSVYQKFEKMLIDKLNYLVDKTAAPDEPMGALNAVQLTEKYENFNKKGNVRQCGFVFYIPAWNTSKLDPATGFVNLFDTRLDSMLSIKAFFSKFDSIRYNEQKDWFEFNFDYNNFTTRAEGTRTMWTLCTAGDRIETRRDPDKMNQFVSNDIDLNGEFKRLFGAVDAKSNLKQHIADMDSKQSQVLLHLFKLMLQMRNSKTNSDVDYLVSPIADKNGQFFDSRTCGDNMPANADANGAFNIARKGLMLVQQIQDASDIGKVDYDMSNKNWLRFAQNINK